MRKPVPFLTNRSLMEEIDRCKRTYCYYLEEKDCDYDVIVSSVKKINKTLIKKTLIAKAAKLNAAARVAARDLPKTAAKIVLVKASDLDPKDLIFRVMTDEHIPDAPEESRRRNQIKVQLPFAPFKHYRLFRGKPKEVVRSHWTGGFENGEFCITQGKLTDRLGKMIMLITQKYATKGNWRGYSYVDAMRSEAILNLITGGLKFDESRSDNPFAYWTQIMKSAFTKIWHKEKRVQVIRDILYEEMDTTPSHTRQGVNDLS